MFDHPDFDSVRRAMREVAEEHILPYFRKLQTADIAYKVGDDPVTIADKKAEIALTARLLDLLPGSKVVGEEAFATNRGMINLFLEDAPVWIIDPIDGTRNFVSGSHKFGVIVGLSKRNQTVAGWIYDPTSHEMVEAEHGAGAFYKGLKLKTAPTPAFTAMFGYMGDRLVSIYEASEPTQPSPRYSQMSAGAHEYPSLVLQQSHFGNDHPVAHYRASLLHSTPWDDAAGVLIHQESGGVSA